jgi:DNA-binding PadR family transcriptional regulator
VRATTEPRTATLTITEAAVLCLLAVNGESSGYDLARHAARSVGHVWAPARSRLYGLLPRLVADGYADVTSVVQDTRPDKRLYRLTPAGDAALARWLATVEPGATDALLLRVFYGGMLPRETLAAHLGQFREDVRGRLEDLGAIEATNTGTGHDRFHRLLIRYGRARAEAELRWAEEVLAEL